MIFSRTQQLRLLLLVCFLVNHGVVVVAKGGGHGGGGHGGGHIHRLRRRRSGHSDDEIDPIASLLLSVGLLFVLIVSVRTWRSFLEQIARVEDNFEQEQERETTEDATFAYDTSDDPLFLAEATFLKGKFQATYIDSSRPFQQPCHSHGVIKFHKIMTNNSKPATGKRQHLHYEISGQGIDEDGAFSISQGKFNAAKGKCYWIEEDATHIGPSCYFGYCNRPRQVLVHGTFQKKKIVPNHNNNTNGTNNKTQQSLVLEGFWKASNGEEGFFRSFSIDFKSIASVSSSPSSLALSLSATSTSNLGEGLQQSDNDITTPLLSSSGQSCI